MIGRCCLCGKETCIRKWMPSDYPGTSNYYFQIMGDLAWNCGEYGSVAVDTRPVPTAAAPFETHYTAYKDGLRGSFDTETVEPAAIQSSGISGPFLFADTSIASRVPGISGKINAQTHLGNYNYQEKFIFDPGIAAPPCSQLFAGRISANDADRYLFIATKQPEKITIQYDRMPCAFSVTEDVSQVISIDLPEMDLGNGVIVAAKTCQIRVYYPSTSGPGPHGLTSGTADWAQGSGVGVGYSPKWGAGHPYGNSFRYFHRFYLHSTTWWDVTWSDIPHTWANTEDVRIRSSMQFDYDWAWREGKASVSVDGLVNRVNADSPGSYWRYSPSESTLADFFQGTVSGEDTSSTYELTPYGVQPEQTLVRQWQGISSNSGIWANITFAQVCEGLGIACDPTQAYFMRVAGNPWGSLGPPTEIFQPNNSWVIPGIGTVNATFNAGARLPRWANGRTSLGGGSFILGGNAPYLSDEEKLKPPTWSKEIEEASYKEPETFSFNLEEEASDFAGDATGSFTIERRRVPT